MSDLSPASVSQGNRERWRSASSSFVGSSFRAVHWRTPRLESQRENLRWLSYSAEDVGTKRFKPLSVGYCRRERSGN